MRAGRLLSAVVVLGALGLPAPVSSAQTFVVTSTADSGAGTLRAAITSANASPGTDTITFAVGTGPQTIALTSELPTITDPVVIDGTTQPGYAGLPLVALYGFSGNNARGLEVTASNSTIRGLVIGGWAWGDIDLKSQGGNLVELNALGFDPATNQLRSGSSFGVIVWSGAQRVERNAIANLGSGGVYVTAGHGTVIAGNRLGTDWTGSIALGGSRGVVSCADDVVIGGPDAASANVISGNTVGVELATMGSCGSETPARNRVEGNRIGTDAAGSRAVGNGIGIAVRAGSGHEITGNLVSGNRDEGIVVDVASTVVAGNTVGLDAASEKAVGNRFGVVVTANDVLIGGDTPAARNVISGNAQSGVRVSLSAARTLILGNSIGLDGTGAVALGNGIGVEVTGTNTRIGGAGGEGNVVSGNNGDGIYVIGAGPAQIEGNLIGTNAAGTAAVGNRGVGVALWAPDGSVIGGPGEKRNVLSGNEADGVWMGGCGRNTTVAGNFIGTDVSGTKPLGNKRHGVLVGSCLRNVLVGGPAAGDGNVIAANAEHGVFLVSADVGSATVVGNTIGLTSDGTPAGNGRNGVSVEGHGSTVAYQVGGAAAGEGNTIAHNGEDGVWQESEAMVAIVGNMIFKNGGLGIDVEPPGVTQSGSQGGALFGVPNAPVVTDVLSASGSSSVWGTLTDWASSTFAVDLYSSAECDPSGHGEGQTYLGRVAATTDSGGQASFTATFPVAIPRGNVVTATATSRGSTSEFSACKQLVPPAVRTQAAGPTSVVEGGAVAYDLFLSSEPLAEVEISITAPPELVVKPSRVVVGPANWRTRTRVEVAAVDDRFDQPDSRPVVVRHTASSTDVEYEGLSADLAVTVLDNDLPVAYFALGDGVASGYGLPGDVGACRQSGAAYPARVLSLLRLERTAEMTQLSCHGTRAAAQTAANPESPLAEQAKAVVAARRPATDTVVSITAGSVDVWLSDPIAQRSMLCEAGDDAFKEFLAHNVLQAKAGLASAVAELLGDPSTVVVLTELYQPLNPSPTYLNDRAAVGGFTLPCRTDRAYDRAEQAAHAMNNAIAAIRAQESDAQRRARIRIAYLHGPFHGHEAAAPACGTAPISEDATYVQYPGRGYTSAQGGDCVHPNERGAQLIAEVVLTGGEPAALDPAAPQTTLLTEDNSLQVEQLGGSIRGWTTDAGSGVSLVYVTFRAASGATLTATARCGHASRFDCLWSVPLPLVPGVYRVSAQAVDLAGNLEPPGPQITVVSV